MTIEPKEACFCFSSSFVAKLLHGLGHDVGDDDGDVVLFAAGEAGPLLLPGGGAEGRVLVAPGIAVSVACEDVGDHLGRELELPAHAHDLLDRGVEEVVEEPV